MKKDEQSQDDLRPEYRREDFGPMVRGKYAPQMRESTNIVVLDPDVAEAFPNAEIVNQTLRRLLELAKASVHSPTPRPGRSLRPGSQAESPPRPPFHP